VHEKPALARGYKGEWHAVRAVFDRFAAADACLAGVTDVVEIRCQPTVLTAQQRAAGIGSHF